MRIRDEKTVRLRGGSTYNNKQANNKKDQNTHTNQNIPLQPHKKEKKTTRNKPPQQWQLLSQYAIYVENSLLQDK